MKKTVFEQIQYYGNKIPHPFFLFLYLGVVILVLSMVLSILDVSVIANVVDRKTGTLTEKFITTRNLVSSEYLREVLGSFVKTYINFPPLGLVMVTLLAIGFVNQTGYFKAAMTAVCNSVPKYMVTFWIVILSCMADVASNAGIIISTTVAAAVFYNMGRSPVIGAAIGYAAAHGAEPTNFLLTGFMITISSITDTAIQTAGIPESINPLSNYIFLLAGFVLLAIGITFTVEKILPRILDESLYHAGCKQVIGGNVNSTEDMITLESTEKKNDALFYSTISGLCMACLIICYLAISMNSTDSFRDVITKSVIGIIVTVFLTIGVVFGYTSGSIEKLSDIPKNMEKGLGDAGMYMVVCFPAAFAIKFFGDSNLAVILSVKGAEFLKMFNLPPYILLLGFIFMVIFINLFVTSGSAKWLVFAPIFVPMFYQLDISPAWTQVAYVIADTISDPCSILNYYIPVVITIANRYQPEHTGKQIGLGDVYAITIPIAIVVGLLLLTQFTIWWICKFPLGL